MESEVEKQIKLTNPVTVPPDLWATSVMPEGIIENWLLADGSFVEAGDPVAIVRIEDCLHEILAPGRGRLRAGCKTNTVIEPGMAIGHIVRTI
jgi:hypothetical protein